MKDGSPKTLPSRLTPAGDHKSTLAPAPKQKTFKTLLQDVRTDLNQVGREFDVYIAKYAKKAKPRTELDQVKLEAFTALAEFWAELARPIRRELDFLEAEYFRLGGR